MVAVACSNPAQAQETPKEKCKAQLDKIVTANLKDKQVTDAGKQELATALNRGVESLGKANFDPGKVSRAETNLKKLITDAVEASGNRPIDAAHLKRLLHSKEWAYPPFCKPPD